MLKSKNYLVGIENHGCYRDIYSPVTQRHNFTGTNYNLLNILIL